MTTPYRVCTCSVLTILVTHILNPHLVELAHRCTAHKNGSLTVCIISFGPYE